ncbi:ABC transporter permease [Paenibacillus polymyxa]|jgi:peptide/nickel transport system permease protein|uniref:nickel ABC transporter permease n=1 Tax=Paenibacillus TaxID=44249 RepID=UPI00042EFF72|nr:MULTISPECIES: nickel ABC transporter permease [Paenibacillus]AHM66227.1 peptide ABC transporter permease [Paenibacillus polymyxa SQR-21]AIY07173.1 nickel transporter permease NikB [Paenibacillus polymyxa]KAF6616484.1 ABC transporter permease [Paenibacillus sp. EKM101P]KAF6623782.1 ABC transporter permease [Paenibacillus sp. EKM102P]KAF6633655.1 ABC transporter permease [Paenibacillus sp. EKM10P]
MFQSIAKKFLTFMLFFLILSFVSFCLLKLVPGDPVRSILRVDDVAVSNQQIADMRSQLGLDQPLPVQYGKWLVQLLQLDFGQSYLTHRPVLTEFIEKLPYTLLLTGGSLFIMLLIALPLGTLSALYRNRWIDSASRVFALIGSSIPSFWLGLLFIEWFAVKLRILPSMGDGTVFHLVLPSLTLGLAMAAVYVRMIRASLIESSGQDFIKAAQARGISPVRIFFRHMFRHSLVPLITVFSESIGSLLGGTVVIEVLFAYPGLGKWIVDAIAARDYPIIQGYTIFMAVFIICLNILVELSYRWVNPEIALKEKGLS